MSDQKSKDVFLGILNYRITHDLEYVKGLPDMMPYFDSGLIDLGENSVFLDCGAFIGDTLHDFIKITGGKYRRIGCFEPNPDNVGYLREYIGNNHIKNVDIFEYGLSDKKQILSFGGTSEGGRISKEGNIKINCDSLDNLCLNLYDRVDFIKMDLEGSEYWALQGARKIIQRDHPMLAICVYHRWDDFYKLTRLIKELYNGYKLYFRQYELSGEETVCIAVP